MFIDKNAAKEILKLSIELMQIWDGILNHGLELTPVKKARSQEIIKEIAKMGFGAEVLSVYNPLTEKEDVRIKFIGPGPNMSPEAAKIYDRWFLETNGIKAD